jgi:RNA polymerase sigma-70 factor, ECF subfamily
MDMGRGDHEVTDLLLSWQGGDNAALEKLVPLIYRELHRTAHNYMARERTGHTLQTTALVNEVYMRLVDFQSMPWQSRNHFFAICANLMRRVLTDFARSRRSIKRGGGEGILPFDEELFGNRERADGIVALDDALNALAQIDERKSRIVELRFFGGLSTEETAQVLNVSVETVHRDWRLAKAWLFRELNRCEEVHGS